MARGRSPSPPPSSRHRERSRSPTRRYHKSRDRSDSRERRRRQDSRDRDRPDRHHRRSEHGHSRSRSRSRDRRRDRERDKQRSYSRDRKRRRRSRSRSGSSDSSSSSEHEEERRRRKKERKERKERKREKKRKKKEKASASAAAVEWGKHGIISDADLYAKDAEFRAWLVEERMINPETLSRDQTRKHFAKFVEDYNTGTLPHDKFYDMERYERQMDMVRNGDLAPLPEETYDLTADLRAHSSKFKKDKGEEAALTTEELQELRRVQNERIQMGKMKLLGMDVKQNMGVRMDVTYE